MSFVTAKSDNGALRKVAYHPSEVHTYGPSGRYRSVIPAYVIVHLGNDGVVFLSVEDAETLLAALPAVLAEHGTTTDGLGEVA